MLYADPALLRAVVGLQKALTALRGEKSVRKDPGLVALFAERQAW